MKAFNAFAMTVAFFISGAVLAADGRKEATMDAGKGAFKLTVSVPADKDGPYDFSKNKGPVVNDQKGAFVVGETMFLSRIGETSGQIYQARIDRSYEVKTEDQRITAEKLAKIMIEQEGFLGREKRIPCPPAIVEGADMACYKMSGAAKFKGKEASNKQVSILASVAFGNGTMGYTLMGTTFDHDTAKFDADPMSYEKGANGAIVQLYKHHKVTLNR